MLSCVRCTSKRRSIRNRYNRVYFVLLLGYFKVKPVVLNIRYSDVREDLQFIAGEFFPGMKLGRKTCRPCKECESTVGYSSY